MTDFCRLEIYISINDSDKLTLASWKRKINLKQKKQSLCSQQRPNSMSMGSQGWGRRFTWSLSTRVQKSQIAEKMCIWNTYPVAQM